MNFTSAGELSRQLALASGAAPLAPSTESKERVVPEFPRRTPSSVPLPPESKDRVVQEPLRRSPSSVPLPSESKDRAAQEPLRRTPSSIPLPPGSKDQGAQELLRRTPSSIPPPPESKEGVAPESLHRTPPPEPPPEGPIKGKFRIPMWLWALALVLIALVFGVRLLLSPPQVPEIAILSVRTEPPGATLLLDGKPPQVPPDTFTHVSVGTHQLSATLDKYEPIKQDIQIRAGMSPEIHLQLTSIPEIAALSVRTEPAGASILLDGKPPQVPPNTFTHVPFGPHRLSATLDNYEPVTQDIQVRKGMTPEVRLQLKPSQEIAALAVQTEPTGAAILLDGKPPQVPPNTFTHVPFGPHQLSATLDNYEPVTMDLQVRAGMSPEVRLQLKPSLEIPALTIQTEPTGAAILLDGRPPQIPPNTFTHVPFGTHRLSATLDNYEPLEQDLQVRRGMNPEIRLEIKPSQEIATLSVQTEPAGAAILLDGKPPQVPPNTFTHVPFGPHQLSATLDNYEPFKQDLQVRRGMNPEVHLELKLSQEIAALSVQTEPSGAVILLDGRPPQVPPNTFTHVPFGPHQLSATLDNYEPFKQDLQVRRGMNPEVRLELKQIQEIAALTVQAEPSGAAILLDGKPPQVPPRTFTHVPFGSLGSPPRWITMNRSSRIFRSAEE